jgi:hypothetical protein
MAAVALVVLQARVSEVGAVAPAAAAAPRRDPRTFIHSSLNGPHMAPVPKRWSKSTVAPPTAIEVGGSLRVDWSMITDFLSLDNETPAEQDAAGWARLGRRSAFGPMPINNRRALGPCSVVPAMTRTCQSNTGIIIPFTG